MSDFNLRKISVARSNAHDLADELSAILALHWFNVETDGVAWKNAEERAIDNIHDIAKAFGFRLVPADAIALVGSLNRRDEPALMAAE